MPRRKRHNWPLLTAILAVVVLLLVYVVGWPLATNLLTPAQGLGKRSRVLLVPLGEQIPIRLFEFLIFAWLFVFGSCLGSFLNVVIYRIPRGLSLWGSSHCPFCRVRIPAQDNVPVFGWLMLRGRCSTCHLPISPRYPLVELAVGLVILILGMLEILLAGLNLPGSGERLFTGLSVSWLVVHPRWDLIVTCLLHSGLVCVLLSWTLIRYDGRALPKGYVAFVFVVALVLTALAPVLEPSARPTDSQAWQAWLTGWAVADKGVVGLLGGGLLGLIVASGFRLAGRDAVSRQPRSTDDLSEPALAERGRPTSGWGQGLDALTAFGLVGACLGWPAALSVGLLGAIARLVGALTLGLGPRRRNASLLAYVWPATFLQICLWRWLDALDFWPSHAAGSITLVAAATMVWVLTWQASVLERLAARMSAAPDGSAGS